MPVPRRIQAPARSYVFGYKYVTPRDPPPPDDPFHQDHQHWQYLDTGTDYLDYNGTDLIPLERKFKQMAFKVYQHYDLDRKLRAYAFEAGYEYGIYATWPFKAKSRAVFNLEHKINIDKYNQELYATERRLLNYPEFEVYKQQHQDARHVIKISFDAGYNYAKKEAFMPSAILRTAVGGPHVTQVYEHRAAKSAASRPPYFKTYKQILFEILAKDRNDRLAAQARTQADAEYRANTWRGAITSGLSSLGSRLKTQLLYPREDPPRYVTDLLGGRSRRNRVKKVVSKITTRCRRKSRHGRIHCK